MENISLKVVNDNLHYNIYVICELGKFELCEMYEHDLGCVGFAKVNGYSDNGIHLLNADNNKLNPKVKYQIELESNKPYELEFDFNKVYQELAKGKLKVKKFKFTKWATPLFVE